MSNRGEFKTPGGKLIAVEFEVRERALRDVVVTGDFFLYPEEALPRLSGSLEGAPITLSAEEYAARVEAALTGVELLGSSSQALATAVERALQLQTGTEDSDDH